MLEPTPRDAMSVTILEAVFKILFPGAASRIEGIASIANVVGTSTGSRAKKALVRRLEDASDQIVDRLQQVEATEFGSMPEGERDIAVRVVNERLHALQIDPKTLYDVASTENLLDKVGKDIEQSWSAQLLSANALSYGHRYLYEACQIVVALVHDLPGVRSDVVWETFILTKKLSESIDQAINSVVLPQYRFGTLPSTQRFEARYLSDVLTDCKHIELFGLRLPWELRRQPVDIAYIRLRTSLARRSSAPSSFIALPAAEDPRVDEAIGAVAQAAVSIKRRGVRIVITGAAGSGKTTIVQWIATRMADHSLPESLTDWSDCIPFVVKLRKLFPRTDALTEQDLILSSAHRYPYVPGGWIRSTFSSGRAVVMCDGLDELNDADRESALRWIERLAQDNPGIHVIITMRPEAHDGVWFDRHGFTHMQLQAMNPSEVRHLIHRWFAALLAYANNDSSVTYTQRMQVLLRDVQNRPALRDLAETPLLCAMLCAFYADNLDEPTPNTRTELYERVVDALAEGRERRKQLQSPLAHRFPLKERLQVLQALARHLVTTSRLTLPVDRFAARRLRPETAVGLTAVEIVAARLAAMPTSRLSPNEALYFLLERSVVFREVVKGEAHFVHRSLQEFLAGRDYGQSGLVEELISHIDEPAWQRVIVFAAGSSPESSATDLVNRMLDLAATAPQQRRVLLLAAESASAAARIDQATSQRIKDALASVLPPRTTDEASLLTGVGEDILDWIGPAQVRDAATLRACIHASARVGGPRALDLIADYTRLPYARETIDEFLANWDRFDEVAYADKVLSALDLSETTVVATSPAQLDAGLRLPAVRHLRLEKSAGIPAWSAIPPNRSLVELNLSRWSRLTTLEGIGRLEGLRHLNLAGQPLRTLDELRDLHQLEGLYLADCGALRNVSALAELPRLRSLVLDGCTDLEDFSALATLAQLRILSLNDCRLTSVEFCRSMPHLRTLRAQTQLGVDIGLALTGCTALDSIDVRLAPSRHRRHDFSACSRLTRVRLRGGMSRGDLESLRAATKLTTFSASGVHGLDLGLFRSFPKLRELMLVDCDVDDATPLSDVGTLRVLDLSGSPIRDLNFVKGLSRLEVAMFNRCAVLRNVTGLMELPKLVQVSLLGGVPAPDDQIRSLERRVPVQYDYPAYDREFYGASS
jgi:hypothetical protein